ncbi:Uma2 family endonuclease [Desulfobacterales bacterium HSG2]|nr:Uma2 family endonuclease [Desulfobacterales bacterium HSG2]
MAEALLKEIIAEEPDFSRIVTEDDEPVDNMFSEKQQRMLTEPLYSSWNPGRPFVAAADVAIFYDLDEPAVVPDTFVSLDVEAPDDMWSKRNRSYFLSEFGKPPEIAVEIVSNTKGEEAGEKFRKYAQAGVRYYIIFDPQKLIQKDALRIYELFGRQYIPKVDRGLPKAGLSVTLWKGVFEEKHNTWLRWVDHEGKLIPLGREQAKTEKKRADKAEKQVEVVKKQVEVVKKRSEKQVEAVKKRAEKAEKQTEDVKKRAEKAENRAEAERKRAEKAEKQVEKQRISTARNLLSAGISSEQISQATGMGLAEVEKLRETDSS